MKLEKAPCNQKLGREGEEKEQLRGRPLSATPASRQLQRNLATRSLSPLPDTNLSNSFKEAQSEKRRFSTPGPQRKEPDGKIPGKIFARDSHRTRASDSTLSSTSISDKLNSRRESSWTKYFDHGGGRVTAVETVADEFKVDLSQLFYGLKFAIGAHNRIYHGIYKDESVAMKILSPPDDDENGAIAARLEKQFTREVTHLSHLRHQNVVKGSRARDSSTQLLSNYDH
ncbi:uncharacterized protein LOC122653847 [Telopea speciosissima]|uniref:uncharacterized protein LOC122653847 n=1 Tax=Telopea speciosissima TaxID=54955 RepID=UPI001CC72808|nr:uncharacterized protein LOC122653847 [Telopea speciosissima]